MTGIVLPWKFRRIPPVYFLEPRFHEQGDERFVRVGAVVDLPVVFRPAEEIDARPVPILRELIEQKDGIGAGNGEAQRAAPFQDCLHPEDGGQDFRPFQVFDPVAAIHHVKMILGEKSGHFPHVAFHVGRLGERHVKAIIRPDPSNRANLRFSARDVQSAEPRLPHAKRASAQSSSALSGAPKSNVRNTSGNAAFPTLTILNPIGAFGSKLTLGWIIATPSSRFFPTPWLMRTLFIFSSRLCLGFISQKWATRKFVR